jgi:hypothetical protein
MASAVSLGRAGRRAGARSLVLLLGICAWLSPARAATPLFTFAQISDSQPGSSADWAIFGRVLDAIVASGTPGALIPQPIDFVLFPGDLVNHGDARRAGPGQHDQREAHGDDIPTAPFLKPHGRTAASLT